MFPIASLEEGFFPHPFARAALSAINSEYQNENLIDDGRNPLPAR